MKRINRAKAKLSYSNRDYKVKSGAIDQDIYSDEGVIFYPKYRRGFKNPNKVLESYQIRQYRTWKYNRFTKFKD